MHAWYSHACWYSNVCLFGAAIRWCGRLARSAGGGPGAHPGHPPAHCDQRCGRCLVQLMTLTSFWTPQKTRHVCPMPPQPLLDAAQHSIRGSRQLQARDQSLHSTNKRRYFQYAYSIARHGSRDFPFYSAAFLHRFSFAPPPPFLLSFGSPARSVARVSEAWAWLLSDSIFYSL